MGVSLRSPASVASSGASHVPPIRDPTIEAHQVERTKRDDDEDPLSTSSSLKVPRRDHLQARKIHHVKAPPSRRRKALKSELGQKRGTEEERKKKGEKGKRDLLGLDLRT
ncbi:hypothetical protein Taro_043134 [Colocasia esculenta]|uniref:Uncharacterized protein n=1 Tax=Colocasia esculenta TaxID=4460 RepID=A0A843WQM4_COLES|nr:hypothetical protein [Colocasia esculenta]